MATPAAAPKRHFAVRVEQDENGLAVRVVGEVDIATAPALESALLSAIESQTASILLDLSDVTFMDSMGMRTLLWATSKSREDGKTDRLRVECGPGQVRRMLELSGLERSVPMTA